MLTPAAEERMAVLLMRELPGSESRIDWAFVFGSTGAGGVVDWKRTDGVAMARRGRREVVGRRRAAPMRGLGVNIHILLLSAGVRKAYPREIWPTA